MTTAHWHTVGRVPDNARLAFGGADRHNYLCTSCTTGIPTQTVRYNKLFPCLRIMTPMLTARTTEDNIVPNRHLLSSTQCRPISHFEDNYYLKNKPQQHQCDDGVPNERLVSDLGYIPQSAIQIDDL